MGFVAHLGLKEGVGLHGGFVVLVEAVCEPFEGVANAHLDPALRARLESARQRPDLKPATRAKIEALLNPRKHHLPTAEHGSPEQ